MIAAQLNPGKESAETDRAANKYQWTSALLSAQLTCLPPFELTESSLPPDHMPAKTCALLESDRRIKKNNGPASWHFGPWISFILLNKHQPSYQLVELLRGDDAE